MCDVCASVTAQQLKGSRIQFHLVRCDLIVHAAQHKHVKTQLSSTLQQNPIDRVRRVSIADGHHVKGIMWESITAAAFPALEIPQGSVSSNLMGRGFGTPEVLPVTILI